VLEFDPTLRAAQAGDEEAFARLWRQFQPGLLRYLRVKAGPMAEDLASDVWTRVVGALCSFDGDEPQFGAWLYTTARHRVTDWYRSRYRTAEALGLSGVADVVAKERVEHEVEARSATDTALAMIAQLPPAQAEAVMLRVVAGLDVPRVARVMGRSPGAVRVLCHRGLKHLERRLREQAPGAEPEAAGMAEGAKPADSAPTRLESA